MSGKRLRIRARVKLSEQNLDWLAGHVVGCKEGFGAGVTDANRRDATEKAGLLSEIVGLETKLAKVQAKLQEQSYLVLDARRATEAANKRALAFEQQLLVPPAHSDWLHLPPFVLRANSAIDKDKLYTNLYGGTVTGRTPGRFPTMMTDAEGGILSPEISRRMIEQIMGASPILGSSRTVPMRPPGDPTFHWRAEDSSLRDGEPIQELHGTPVDPPGFVRTMMENPQLIRDAFRSPVRVSSEMRTPEAEEGIRRASAEGVTDRAGGHSHSIDLDIRVDDSQLQDAITRLDGLSEVVGNAVVSTEEFERAMSRVLRLERTMGIEDSPEESAGEENVNVTGRPDTEGGEHTPD